MGCEALSRAGHVSPRLRCRVTPAIRQLALEVIDQSQYNARKGVCLLWHVAYGLCCLQSLGFSSMCMNVYGECESCGL